ncbi:MAG: glycosyltransferase family 2 protein [Oligoflexia bacterium]|nr:glycosyltransferase family 2 protein [Oligoflexia bacterium]
MKVIQDLSNGLSIVIPVYNAKDCLFELHNRLQRVCCLCENEVEIILVNDGSNDDSYEILEKLQREDTRVKCISLQRNNGQLLAIAQGLAHASGKYILIMDCDLQDRPEDILKLKETLIKKNCDVVFAKKQQRKDKWHRKFFSFCFHKVLFFITKVDSRDIANFCIFTKRTYLKYRHFNEHFRNAIYYFSMKGLISFEIVLLEQDKRFLGKSSYSFRKLCLCAFCIVRFAILLKRLECER